MLALAKMYLEVLRFLINDRICVFRNTHMFGYIILVFSGKYYLNRMLYVYVYWYNTKSSSTEIILKSYLLSILRENAFYFFSNFNFKNTWNFRLYVTNLYYTHLPTRSVTDPYMCNFQIFFGSFQNIFLILLWDSQQNKVKCNCYNNSKLYRNN